jgi:capsid protein
MKEAFDGLRERVWDAYHASNARSFSQRLRRLREWAEDHVGKEVVREKVRALCNKRRAFARAYDHPGCCRTSNLVDRLLRRLDYHLYCTQHLHGTPVAAEQGLRGWALIHNFAPSCPETVREAPTLRSPAERLNGMRYHPEWLQNLLVSASLGGYRRLPRKA